jgi:hypothetical protein
MAALTYSAGCEGVLAVEKLNLDAGQLGPVLLFNLAAQGVGYTSSAKEVALAQWASKLAGLKVGGGERWTGTIESEEDVAGTGAKQWRVVRRIVVPPGVALTQVYRSAAAPSDAKAGAAAEEFGLVRVRQLDATALTAAVPGGGAAGGGRSGGKLPLGVPSPAGFGLDLLPGFKVGLRYDFAVQPMIMPRTPEASLSGILQAVFRR